MKELINKYPRVFDKKAYMEPPPRVTDHHIELQPGSRPPARRIYRLSPLEEKELKEQLEDHLREGRIRPSNSPFGASVVFAPKKGGALRMCVDY